MSRFIFILSYQRKSVAKLKHNILSILCNRWFKNAVK